MHLAPLSLTGLTDSKQKLYQMKLFLQKTANCTRSAASYAAALPAPRAAAPWLLYTTDPADEWNSV